MNKLTVLLISFLVMLISTTSCFAEKSFEENKKEIIAVYNTNNLEEAYKEFMSKGMYDKAYKLLNEIPHTNLATI